MSDNKERQIQVTEAFGRLAELGSALGVRLNLLPGTWRYQVDDQWHIEMNGHKEALPNKIGVPIEPYQCHIEFNGWPAGVLDPFGGVIAAGECANEDTFIEAIRKATIRISARLNNPTITDTQEGKAT